MLISGRKDLIPHALQMLPHTKVCVVTPRLTSTNCTLQVNTVNQQGLTPLMVACLR